LARVDPDAISKLGFGRIHPDVLALLPETWAEMLARPVIKFPTQTSFLVLGAIFALSGLTVIVLPPWRAHRWEGWLMGLVGLATVMAVLLGAAMGKRVDVVGMLADSVRLATPIALGAMAGVLSERAGVINIAIEGMMLTAACLGFAASLYLQSSALGLVVAILSATVMAALHAVLSIQFQVDQIVSGTVVNILAVGITGFVRRSFLLSNPFGAPGVFPPWRIPVLSKIPVLGQILFSHQPMVYSMIVLVILIHFYLFHTPWGLRHRAVGEHPQAADTLGINVFRIRYLAVLASGAVAGLGGAWFSLETVGSFDDLMTGGKGFIALAAMIFGKWNPINSALGAGLFGFADALNIKLQILEVGVPYQFIGMLPYFLTIIVLAGLIGRAIPPAADGIPYEKQ